MESNITIRPLKKSDPLMFSQVFSEMGWDKPKTLYEQYLEYQKKGTRDILVADWKGKFAGYLTINWKSDYAVFKENNIPEINDFNVLEQYRRKGIGTFLMDEAERRIADKSDFAGIGFGLYTDYGPAQILYINRGYIPDGKGLIRDGQILKYGEEVKVDDALALYLIKQLKQSDSKPKVK